MRLLGADTYEDGEGHLKGDVEREGGGHGKVERRAYTRAERPCGQGY